MMMTALPTFTTAAAFIAEALLWAAAWGIWLVGVVTVFNHAVWLVAGYLDRRGETKLIDHAARAKAELDRPHGPLAVVPAPTPPADRPRR